MPLDLLKIQDKILEFLNPLCSENFKLLDHPFDPTDETVRQVQIINVEYKGEVVDNSANRRQGGVSGKHPMFTTLNYSINIWYKKSRILNSRAVIPFVEQAINLLIGKNVFEDASTIGKGDIILESVKKVEKDSGHFFRYEINISIKATR